MALALTLQQISSAMTAANSDFKFLMDREGVSLDMQAKIYHAGVTNTLAADADELRKIMKEEFALDPTGNLANRIELSKIVVSWESSKGRSAKMTEIEAESEVRDTAKPIRTTDFKAMKDAYQEKWWKIEGKAVPAKQYVEKISEGVERAEPRAEPLSEVVNVMDGKVDVMKAVWDDGAPRELVPRTWLRLGSCSRSSKWIRSQSIQSSY